MVARKIHSDIRTLAFQKKLQPKGELYAQYGAFIDTTAQNIDNMCNSLIEHVYEQEQVQIDSIEMYQCNVIVGMLTAVVGLLRSLTGKGTS